MECECQTLQIIEGEVGLVAVFDLVDLHQRPIELFRQCPCSHSALFPVAPDIPGQQTWRMWMFQPWPQLNLHFCVIARYALEWGKGKEKIKGPLFHEKGSTEPMC